MEPEMVGGMVFTLILAFMVGGFILLFPLSRRLGALIESRVQEKVPPPVRVSDKEIAALREAVAELNTQVDRLADRQDFMEKLLSQRMDPRPLGRAPDDTARGEG